MNRDSSGSEKSRDSSKIKGDWSSNCNNRKGHIRQSNCKYEGERGNTGRQVTEICKCKARSPGSNRMKEKKHDSSRPEMHRYIQKREARGWNTYRSSVSL